MGVIAVIAVLLVALGWFLWPSKTATVPRRERADVDEAELEAAERDVQDAADQDSVRDWGPGTGRAP